MAKFEEAEARLFRNIFVCSVCKRRNRAPGLKVRLGKVRCRKCNSKQLRPIRKK